MIEEFESRFTEKGYVEIKVNNQWIREHIYVVEQFIKRPLNNEEVIHHINQYKFDNRIENLMLFPNNKEHAKFHNKIRQFGYTNPVKKQIRERWNQFKPMEITA